MDQFFTHSSTQLPVNIHGFLVSQMSKSLANQNATATNPANERQNFQRSTNESEEFWRPTNEGQEFQRSANEREEFQVLTNERQGFQGMPNPAVMIRPPHQQSRPIRGGGQAVFSGCPPSPKKGMHHVQHQPVEDDPRWPMEPELDGRDTTGH